MALQWLVDTRIRYHHRPTSLSYRVRARGCTVATSPSLRLPFSPLGGRWIEAVPTLGITPSREALSRTRGLGSGKRTQGKRFLKMEE